jgi:hypothetical protein
MVCYLEDYRARMDSWAAKTSWRTSLLIIGGVEQNPGPGVEAQSTVQALCRGTQCDTCDACSTAAVET